MIRERINEKWCPPLADKCPRVVPDTISHFNTFLNLVFVLLLYLNVELLFLCTVSCKCTFNVLNFGIGT